MNLSKHGNGCSDLDLQRKVDYNFLFKRTLHNFYVKIKMLSCNVANADMEMFFFVIIFEGFII
jgi:hypothetical protein